MSGELPAQWDEAKQHYLEATRAKAETVASRKASQNAINGYAPALPELLGGSADLAGSNLTLWKGAQGVTRNGGGNYLFYGVREFAMRMSLD